MQFETSETGNGVKVVTEHMDGVRSVALGLWVRVGSRDEAPQEAGMSHFMEHMLFKGTPTHSAFDISATCDALGAELNAFTSREYTCFYCRVIDEHLPEVFEVLADMLANASFEQDDIDLERGVVIEEIAGSEDDPADHVYDVFFDALMPTHPLGRPVLGSRQTVSSFKTADMRAYHDAHYTAANVTVVACGSVDHAQVVELAQRWLADLPCGMHLERPSQDLGQCKHLACALKDTEQANLLYGVPGVASDDSRRYALALLSTVLGGGMSSRLFQEVREKRGLVYSIYTVNQLYEDAGMFAVYAGTNPANVEQVISVVRDELAAVAQFGITDEELHRARELTCGSYVLGMESTASRMVRVGRLMACDLPLVSVDETLAGYHAVTADEVQGIAAELFAAEPTLAVVSPRSAKDLQQALN